MVVFAQILLGAMAIVGIGLLIGHLGGSRPPLFSVGMLHGILALIALVVLLAAAALGRGGTGMPLSGSFLLIAAILGLLNFSFRFRRKPLPITMIVVHGLAAIVGYIFLVAG